MNVNEESAPARSLMPRMKLPIAFLRQPSLFVLAALGILVAVRLWILPLGNSFWLDESLVVSIAKNRIADLGAAAYQAPSQSTLFFFFL